MLMKKNCSYDQWKGLPDYADLYLLQKRVMGGGGGAINHENQ
jgi:hypothetical protein